MDKRTNPYTPGPGTPPPYLAGREDEIEDIQVIFDRLTAGMSVEHPVYAGLRGVGKTTILTAAMNEAEDRGWQYCAVEGDTASSPIGEFRINLENMAHNLGEQNERFLAKAMRCIEQISLSLGPVGVGAGFHASGEMERQTTPWLTELIVSLGEEARRQGTGVALAFDEVHLFSGSELKAISGALHLANQRKLPIAFFLAGLPQIAPVLQASKTYAERLTVTEVDKLDIVAARESLVVPARDLGVAYEPDALETIVKATAGYPYFLQLFGSIVWNEAEASPVSMEAVKSALTQYRKRLDKSFFKGRYSKATPAEKRYLHAMAGLLTHGRSGVSSRAVAESMETNIGSVSPLRDALIKKGLIYARERGALAFTVPLFGDYLRRHRDQFEAGINDDAVEEYDDFTIL